MSGELYGIVQAHADRWGVRAASIARQIGAKPQTISSWKHRGVRQLPDPVTLSALAQVTGRPYREVIDAALTDAGYLPRRTVATATGHGVGRRPVAPQRRPR